jgi:hypothetical protein
MDIAASSNKRNMNKNKKNKTLAIPAAATATPVNPNTPAMIETMKNTSAQYNIAAFS